MNTVLDLFHDIHKQLETYGVSDCDSESFIILSHVLNYKTRSELFMNGNQILSDKSVHKVNAILAKRKERLPLAYAIGEQDFWSKTFIASPDVLIPRPETELLIEKTLATISLAKDSNHKIVDFGTGSGVIAIILALEIESASIFGIDKSINAIKVAKKNAKRQCVEKRVQFINSDWSGGLLLNNSYDLVVSNPPYVAHEVLDKLQPELSFEPQMALNGGVGGVIEIDRLLEKVTSILKFGGWLFVEIGFDQKNYILEKVNKLKKFDHVMVHNDYAGLARIFQAKYIG